ncbi:unnamed protein product [Rotaria sp. Silwood1]|nr:unnamed protein product [Rotaria sp. Silwood1]
MHFFNYQFELYDANISLINDIRERFEQKLFHEQEQLEIKNFLDHLDNDSILQLSGLLEYILTYLRTVNNKNIIKMNTIQTFLKENIPSKTCIDNKIRENKSFSSIYLEYIIDLYELIEEYIFDKILCDNIRNDLCERSFSIDQQISIVDQFIEMILHNNNIADCFKNLTCWISMFKRLLVRLLSPNMNINFDSSLDDYVKRTDIWKGNVTKNDIQTIEINKSICLKHAYIILNGLKKKQNELIINENQRSQNNIEQQEQNQSITATSSDTVRSTNSSQRSSGFRRNAFRKY